MSLVLDEKELVKQVKEQGALKDIADGFFKYKLFDLIAVETVLIILIVIFIYRGLNKK